MLDSTNEFGKHKTSNTKKLFHQWWFPSWHISPSRQILVFVVGFFSGTTVVHLLHFCNANTMQANEIKKRKERWCADDIFIHNSFYQSSEKKTQEPSKLCYSADFPPILNSKNVIQCACGWFFMLCSLDFMWRMCDAARCLTIYTLMRWCNNPLASRYALFYIVLEREIDSMCGVVDRALCIYLTKSDCLNINKQKN